MTVLTTKCFKYVSNLATGESGTNCIFCVVNRSEMGRSDGREKVAYRSHMD